MLAFVFRLVAAMGIVLAVFYAKERYRSRVLGVTDARGTGLLSSDIGAHNESIGYNASFVTRIGGLAAQAVAAIDARPHLSTCLNTLGVSGLLQRVNVTLVAYVEHLQEKSWFRNARSSQMFMILIPFLLGVLSASWWRRCGRDQRKKRAVAGIPPTHRRSNRSLSTKKESGAVIARPTSTPARMTPRVDNDFRWLGQDISVYYQHHTELELKPTEKSDVQIAAAKVIQRWVRTRLKKWISKAVSSGSLTTHLVSLRNCTEEGDGAVVATVRNNSDLAPARLGLLGSTTPDYSFSPRSGAVNVTREDLYHSKEDLDSRFSPRACEGKEYKLWKASETNSSAASEINEARRSNEDLDALLPVSSRLHTSPSSPFFLLPKAATSSVASLASLRHRQFSARLPDPRMLTCGELRPRPASERVFGDLLPQCKHRVPVTFDDLLAEIGADSCLKIRESYCSEVFRVFGNRGRAVIKVFHFDYLVRHHELLLAEIRIARALRGLAKDSENYAGGFSEMRAAYCVWDKFSPMMTEGCRNFTGQKASVFTDEDRDLCRPYVVLYMSFAGHPLDEFRFQGALQLRSVVQQVALTLAVGETALQFEHRALTPGHVLVKEAHALATHFRLDGRALFVEMFGVQASVVDFSAARLLPPNKSGSVPLFADLAKIPLNKREALGDTFANVYSLVSEEPSQFSPWTNLAYLQDLIGSLINTYDGPGAADELEQKAWRDLLGWLDEMPRFASARDFARDLIIPSTRSSMSLTAA